MQKQLPTQRLERLLPDEKPLQGHHDEKRSLLAKGKAMAKQDPSLLAKQNSLADIEEQTADDFFIERELKEHETSLLTEEQDERALLTDEKPQADGKDPSLLANQQPPVNNAEQKAEETPMLAEEKPVERIPPWRRPKEEDEKASPTDEKPQADPVLTNGIPVPPPKPAVDDKPVSADKEPVLAEQRNLLAAKIERTASVTAVANEMKNAGTQPEEKPEQEDVYPFDLNKELLESMNETLAAMKMEDEKPMPAAGDPSAVANSTAGENHVLADETPSAEKPMEEDEKPPTDEKPLVAGETPVQTEEKPVADDKEVLANEKPLVADGNATADGVPATEMPVEADKSVANNTSMPADEKPMALKNATMEVKFEVEADKSVANGTSMPAGEKPMALENATMAGEEPWLGPLPMAIEKPVEAIQKPPTDEEQNKTVKLEPGQPVEPVTGTAFATDVGTEVHEPDLGKYGLNVLSQELLERMIMGNPYKCEFVAEGDAKKLSCGKTMNEAGVHPLHLTAEGNKTNERINALRTHLPIGSLPCCATFPFCSAPTCIRMPPPADAFAKDKPPPTCTKRSAKDNFAYMIHKEVWPAYHGNGGSFEMDVQKHWDVLARINGLQPHLPVFDLAIDLGANTGLITERMTMRRFAKDYIMVEAFPNLKQYFDTRFGNEDWRRRFLDLHHGQATTWPGAEPIDPKYEFHNFAISDKPGGFLDTCSFNWGNWTPETQCKAEMASVDSIIPGRLSKDFADRFARAKSAYIKVDVEGMDQMAVKGMERILQEKRGDDFLVNFMMLEFCSPCMEAVRNFNNFQEYDLKTFSKTLEDLGFEAFMMGPRYLPLTHGSWDDAYVNFSKSMDGARCNAEKYPKFLEFFPDSFSADGKTCTWPVPNRVIFTTDIFAMRASHPQAAEIKLALGACSESKDFDPTNYGAPTQPNGAPETVLMQKPIMKTL